MIVIESDSFKSKHIYSQKILTFLNVSNFGNLKRVDN